MISIGDVELSSHLLLRGVKNMIRRVSSTRYTMGGRAVIQSQSVNNGQTIVLVDEGQLGVLTVSQIDAINSYKASGERVTFTHHSGVWQVIVTEIDVTPGDEVANEDETATYFGTITMQITG